MRRRPLQIHIPKTAGTSIRRALGVEDPAHLTGPQLRAHVGKDEWDAGFKFTVVRNPFDRLASFYCWGTAREKRRGLEPGTFLREWPTFTGWVTHQMEDRLAGRLTDTNKSHIDWIGGVHLDFVARFESLQEGWVRIAAELGLGPTPKLPHLLPSDHDGGYRAYYNKVTRALVERAFAEDIAEFGYTF